MTLDEIIDMAKQAGIEETYSLEVFAKLVAEAEREACAKVCDEYADDPVYCGDAIRARGQA